jgi:hypothetical protein
MQGEICVIYNELHISHTASCAGICSVCLALSALVYLAPELHSSDFGSVR